MTTGRPLRNRFEKTRTKFWTAVVYKEIAERGLRIEEVLGERWEVAQHLVAISPGAGGTIQSPPNAY